MYLNCDRFIDVLVVGYVGEWDLSTGDLIEHKISDSAVSLVAISGGKIVTYAGADIRVLDVSTCLLVFPESFFFYELCYSCDDQAAP